MRRSTLCALIFLAICYLGGPRQTQAVVIISDVLWYDSFTNVVYGYASTALTYPEQYYYDAGVDSVLFDQYGVVRDSNFYLGGSFASVSTQTFGSPGVTFNLYSGHYLGFYFYVCDVYQCGYYDYYGYSFYGGEFPSYYEFHPYYYCYVYYSVYEFANTFLQITVPEPECPPGIYVQLRNERVSGVLNGTTQTALLGGNVRLEAVVTGASSGTYTWTVTGVAQQNVSGSVNNIYWRDVGLKTVKVEFRPSGSNCQVSATVNINVILPTLDSFTGQQDAPSDITVVTSSNQCGIILGTFFGIGCDYISPSKYRPGTGINFVAQAHVPQGLISDPSQGIIKFVQLVNTYRMRQVLGQSGYECSTSHRLNPPWVLDTSNPYDSDTSPIAAIADFGSSNPAIIRTGDLPSEYLYAPEFRPTPYNYFYVDDQFEMYVVYTSTVDPSIQIPLAKVPWNWGGEVLYDPNAPNGFTVTRSFSGIGPRPSVPVNSFTPYADNVTNIDYQPCFVAPLCDPDGSQADACYRRGYRYEWDPDSCTCKYVGGGDW